MPRVNGDLDVRGALTLPNTALTIPYGGTGATSAAGARTALGLGTAATKDLSALSIGANYLINTDGSNPINQRGWSDGDAVTTDDYLVDRWYVTHNMTGLAFSQDVSGFGVIVTDATSGTVFAIRQKVEAYQELGGKEVTLTAGVVANNPAYLSVDNGVGGYEESSSAHTGGGTEETLSCTLTTMSSGGSYLMNSLISGTEGVGDYARINWGTLKVEDTTTLWVPPDPAVELARCLRYYWRITGEPYSFIGSGQAGSSTEAAILVIPPVPMRTDPAVAHNLTLEGSVGTNDLYLGDSAGVKYFTAMASYSYHQKIAGGEVTGISINCAGTSGLTAYAPVVLRINGAQWSSNYIEFDAEL